VLAEKARERRQERRFKRASERVEGLWVGALGRRFWPTNINKCRELDTCFKCHFVWPRMQVPAGLKRFSREVGEVFQLNLS